MANVSLYDPFGMRLSRLFADFPWRASMFDEKEGRDFKLDIVEGDKAYTVRADLPGVKKDDITVDIDGNHVSISAHVARTKEEKGENMVYSERCEGKMFRAFTLDMAVDEAKAVAKYVDGVLELTLPKKGNGSTTRLMIQ